MMINLRHSGLYVLVFAVLVFVSYGSAMAQVSFTTNEGQFVADNPGLDFQDFSAANPPVGGLLICGTPIDENTADACFQPGDILPGIQFATSAPGVDLLTLGLNALNVSPADLLSTNTFAASFDVTFSQNPTAVGLNLGCGTALGATCNSTMDIEVFGPGNVFLDDFTTAVSNLADSFVGITSVQPITRINLFDQTNSIETILNVRFGDSGTPNILSISLAPETATNGVFTTHTVTATVLENGSPLANELVEFRVILGPNDGEMSDPGTGECTTNDDCTTDASGQVSWSYVGQAPGTDNIVAVIFDENDQSEMESNVVESIWIVLRNVPTLSEWGLIAMSGLLGIVGFMVIRRRQAAA